MLILILFNFLIVAALGKTLVASFMKLMGVNFYGVDVKKRFWIYLVISVVLALFGI